jgi:hypothetical protein
MALAVLEINIDCVVARYGHSQDQISSSGSSIRYTLSSSSSLGAGSLSPPVRQLRSRFMVFNDHLNLSVKITSSLHRLATEGYSCTRVSPHRTPEGEGEREGGRERERGVRVRRAQCLREGRLGQEKL